MENAVEEVIEEPAADDAPEPMFNASFGAYYEDDILQLLKSENPDVAMKLKSLLIEIISTDNVRAFEFLLSNGYKIEVVNDKNQTCIHLAYYTGSWQILSSSNLWSSNLADDMITCTDTNGLTFLHIACYIADTPLTEKCLNSNLDYMAKFSPFLEQFSHSGFTALHFASMNHELNIVKLLLAHGADVNEIDLGGRTPLHIACCVFQEPDPEIFKEHLDIIELLLENHSSPSRKDNHGNIPLFSIFPDNYNTFNSYFITSLPVIETKLKLELLLKQDVDLNIKNISNESILHRIINNLQHLRLPSDLSKLSFDDINHEELIQKIFNTDPNIEVNEKNSKGQTPLQLAVSYMSIDIVKILLDHGADVNTVKFGIINNDHCFYYPHIIPNLESVINIELITRLLSQKKYHITVQENLNILKFLVHNVKNCECSVLKSDSDIQNRFGKIINFGPIDHKARILSHVMAKAGHKTIVIVLMAAHILTKKNSKFYCNPLDTQLLGPIIQLLSDFQDLHDSKHFESSVIHMKSTTLRDNVSLYDVMVKHPYYVHKYLKDVEDYSLVLNLTNQYNEIFQDIIKGHISYSLTRDYIERSAFSYLEHLFPFLPEPCLKIILDYLDEKSILNACSAAVIGNFKECSVN